MFRHAIAFISILLAVSVHGQAAPKVDFQKEVRPILSDSCFHCHGNDKTTRMAGLRLDTKEGAFAKRAKGAAIVAGNAKASLLVQRITSPVAAQRMPPVYTHKTLSEDQKQTLQRWINEGAKWEEHWAFAAPVRPAVPVVRNEGWARNAVDRFVLVDQRGILHLLIDGFIDEITVHGKLFFGRLDVAGNNVVRIDQQPSKNRPGVALWPLSTFSCQPCRGNSQKYGKPCLAYV